MITLSWPAKELSPNSRVHWSVRAKAVKAARNAAGWATRAAKVEIEGKGAIDLHIYFCPPSKRRYDLDNCLASIKSAIDGIADALGVDDSRFRLHIEMYGVIKGGEVRIVVTG